MATAQKPKAPAPPREPLPPLKMHKTQSIPARSLTLIAHPHGYGRPLRPHWVDTLTEKWDDDKVGVLLVSCRAEDHQYYVLAGNHRVAAKQQAGEPDFLFDCKVHYGLTLPEEADIYLAQDAERLRHTTGDDFLAMLARGDEAATGVKAILDDLGLEVAPYGAAGWKANRVRAVAGLLNAWETNGEDNVRLALGLIRDEWLHEQAGFQHTRKSIWAESITTTLPVFLRLYNLQGSLLEISWLRRAMQREGVAGWEERWQHHRMAAKSRPQGGGALIYGVLSWLDLYNYRRREPNVLDEMVARRASKTLKRSRRHRRGGHA